MNVSLQSQTQPPGLYGKKICPQRFCKFQWKTPSGLQACNFTKTRRQQRCFCEVCERFKNTHFEENSRTTTSLICSMPVSAYACFKIFLRNHLKLVMLTLHRKWSFSLRISSVNMTKSEFPADLVTFTEEILNGKLFFVQRKLC